MSISLSGSYNQIANLKIGYRQPILPTPLARWLFKTSISNTTPDETGVYDITSFNGTITTINNRSCASFNGLQRGTIPSGVGAALHQKTHTVCVWLRNWNNYIYGNNEAGSNFGWSLNRNSTGVYVSQSGGGLSNQTTWTINVVRQTNTWEHLTCVFSYPNTFKVYRNGVLISSTKSNPLINFASANTTYHLASRRSGTEYLGSGQMSDLIFYDRELTEDEIQKIYNMG